jgi:hypothetical protein
MSNDPFPPGKEWTIMIYCAGDNELAPLIVSQLKLLKDAGRHPDVNVVAYFDPSEKGVRTRLYCLNQRVRSIERSALDSFVPNMRDDDVDFTRFKTRTAAKFCKALDDPDKVNALDGLSMFLRFCKENYPAKHFILVLMGHGMIVANDAFLPDESPVSAITLKDLGKALSGFNRKLELIAMHSCSMSAVEVAYELQGKAKYMIASEGLAFVGGYPYRHLLLRLYSLLNLSKNGNGKKPPQKLDVRDLVERLYKLSSHNGMDFMLSGYAQDLALINLDPDKLEPLTKALRRLVTELNRGLRAQSDTPKHLIQLAHLESQSYYDENYTDLYDFCLCLARNCKGKLKELRDACEEVMTLLKPGTGEIDERFGRIVIHSRHFGSPNQHSHGLSIYFPWSKPPGDRDNSVLEKYEDYKFTAELGTQNSWLKFLHHYLDRTLRECRPDSSVESASKGKSLGSLQKPSAAFQKPSGASGASCSCPSIKNFPTEERKVKGQNVNHAKVRNEQRSSEARSARAGK